MGKTTAKIHSTTVINQVQPWRERGRERERKGGREEEREGESKEGKEG